MHEVDKEQEENNDENSSSPLEESLSINRSSSVVRIAKLEKILNNEMVLYSTIRSEFNGVSS